MKKLRKKGIVTLLVFAALFVIHASDSFAMGETSRSSYKITDGAAEVTVYVTLDSAYNIKANIMRISPESGITVEAGYGGYYAKKSSLAEREEKLQTWSSEDWAFESVSGQASDYSSSEDVEGEVIAAVNGDFFDIKTGEPEGSLIIDGHTIKRNEERPFFAVLKDGTMTIGKGDESVGDVEDAISGDELLVWDGKALQGKDNGRDPRVAIGICEDGTVVIVNIDGRHPNSAGATRHEVAEIMLKQGCVKAINLDGGGSATFMTKRKGDKKLTVRSNLSDGFERNISSSLIVVKDSEDRRNEKEPNISDMSDSETRLTKDKNGIFHYVINGEKQDGFYSIDDNIYLFEDGNGVTSSVEIGDEKYTFEKGLLKSSTDKKAGKISIGYCGVDGKNKKDVLYAYHYGDKRLVIGINPYVKKQRAEMMDMHVDKYIDMPWYTFRADIEDVYIGDGVTNLGDYFMYSTKGNMVGGTAAPSCRLQHIRIPSSLETIGEYALYNKPFLKDVELPAELKEIGKSALMYSGEGSISFICSKPPEMGEDAMSETGFSVAYLKRSKSWRQFVKDDKFREYGYCNEIKYRFFLFPLFH